MVTIEELSEHNRTKMDLEDYFKSLNSVIGIFLSGSSATNTMDQYSDIDIGIVIDSNDNLDSIWKKRWDWDLPEWFHRFDADHVRDHFVIYLFEPNVKADIVLYTMDTLPPPEGGPYLLTYVKDSKLTDWNETIIRELKEQKPPSTLNVKEIIHDDERMWAWIYYCYLHLARGEYYTLAADFFMLRAIVEKWMAHFRYQTPFGTRRLETKFLKEDLEKLNLLFPTPDRISLTQACKELIDLTLELRKEITLRMGNIWKTSENSIKHVKEVIESL